MEVPEELLNLEPLEFNDNKKRCGLCKAEVEDDNDMEHLGKHYHIMCYHDLFDDENSQIIDSRNAIKEGKSRRFDNVEEYLKSLDDEE